MPGGLLRDYCVLCFVSVAAVTTATRGKVLSTNNTEPKGGKEFGRWGNDPAISQR